jgi:hypothetical protein
MREIDDQFGLHLTWMNARSPADMARNGKKQLLREGCLITGG